MFPQGTQLFPKETWLFLWDTPREHKHLHGEHEHLPRDHNLGMIVFFLKWKSYGMKMEMAKEFESWISHFKWKVQPLGHIKFFYKH
jgi:hypothetical protein